jgi:hypothetical protein
LHRRETRVPLITLLIDAVHDHAFCDAKGEFAFRNRRPRQR